MIMFTCKLLYLRRSLHEEECGTSRETKRTILMEKDFYGRLVGTE